MKREMKREMNREMNRERDSIEERYPRVILVVNHY